MEGITCSFSNSWHWLALPRAVCSLWDAIPIARRLSRGIVPIDERGNVILVGQYRFPLDAYSWEIPEGGGLPPTSILDSAKRELVEECGVSARCWTEILEMDLSNSVSDEHATAFLAWDLTNATADPEGTEQLQIARVPFMGSC